MGLFTTNHFGLVLQMQSRTWAGLVEGQKHNTVIAVKVELKPERAVKNLSRALTGTNRTRILAAICLTCTVLTSEQRQSAQHSEEGISTKEV